MEEADEEELEEEDELELEEEEAEDVERARFSSPFSLFDLSPPSIKFSNSQKSMLKGGASRPALEGTGS